MKLHLSRWFLAVGALLSTQSAPGEPSPAASQGLPFSTVEWPQTLSAAPTAQAWRSAQPLSLLRISGARATRCNARAVREWLKVACPELRTSAITELGSTGTPTLSHIDPAGDDRIPGAGEVVLQLHPGDRHALMWWTLGEGYDGPLTVVPGLVLQEYWLAEQPVVVLTDALHEPVPTAKTGR